MALKQIVIELLSDTRKVDADFKKIERKTSSLERSFNRLGSSIIAAFGARAVFNAFKQTISSTNELIRTARGVGFTVDEYQQLIFSLDQVGVSASSARIALGDLQKRLSKPQFAKFFKQAGLSPKELLKLPRSEQLNAVLNQLATLRGDPRLPGITGGVFEEQSGKEMLKLLLQFEEYQSARENYAKRIPALSKQEQDSILATRKELALFQAQFERTKQTIVAQAGPAIIRVLDDMEKADVFSKMAEGAGSLVDSIDSLIKDFEFFQTLVDGFRIPGWLKTAWEWSNPVNASLAISKVPFNELNRARKNAEGLAPWFPSGSDPSNGASTTSVTNVNHFQVGRSDEIGTKEAKAIRRAFDEVTRAP